MARTEALVVGNGERPSRELLAELMTGDPLLLCADGGANVVSEYGWTPDYVVGDLDSVSAAVRDTLPDERLICVDADNTGTDLQKVLRHAAGVGVEQATLTGVTGGRTDHVLWNLGLLKVYRDQMALRVVDDHCEIRLIAGEVAFRAPIGQKVSLSPMAGPALGIRTEGLLFPLRRGVLGAGIRDGISNEVVDNPVYVWVEAGDLLLIVHREHGAPAIEWLEP